MQRRSAPMATTNIWFGVGAPAERFVIPGAGRAGARRRTVADDLLRSLPAAAGGEAYREWNFAPSGEWAAYDFTGYREGHDRRRSRHAALHPDGGQFHLVGARRDDRGRRPSTNWELGLSAVLEEKDGTKSYWALAHPPATSPISTTPVASPRGFLKQRLMTLFGIDRLLAEPELRRRSRASASRCSRIRRR